ncbi:MAG: hypothetical protein KDA41_06365, partial [Planctomycetales bacterium]|nr:hypothetical protein [Planctomycetales bacterium]
LRRPGRRFTPPSADMVNSVGVTWARRGMSVHDHDARLISGVRYFTRDMGFLREFGDAPQPIAPAGEPSSQFLGDEWEGETPLVLPQLPGTANVAAAQSAWSLADPPLFDRGCATAPQSGVAGWNDFSGAADAARRSLKDAAGISVPKRDFVLRVLAVYLLALVPLNWGFFRLIGRVEWAWAAAPVVAICGALAVVRMAQLDIGFARSRTEVAVLELQGAHPRGHLTRYMALYTSLSTGWNVSFDERTALAQPFAVDEDFNKLKDQTPSLATLHRDKQVSLRGFNVRSNSTGMLHTEEMRHIGGGLVLQREPRGDVIINKSKFPLRDVGLIRRRTGAQASGAAAIEIAWIGELAPGTNEVVAFGPVTHARALIQQWEESPTTSTQPVEGEVSLLRLLDLARDPRRLAAGDMKLIGWTDADLGGIELSPRATQATLRTLVVANLKYGAPGPPEVDENTYASLRGQVDAPDPPNEE